MSILKPGDLVKYRKGLAWSAAQVGELAIFLEHVGLRTYKVYFFCRKEIILDNDMCFEKAYEE